MCVDARFELWGLSLGDCSAIEIEYSEGTSEVRVQPQEMNNLFVFQISKLRKNDEKVCRVYLDMPHFSPLAGGLSLALPLAFLIRALMHALLRALTKSIVCKGSVCLEATFKAKTPKTS